MLLEESLDDVLTEKVETSFDKNWYINGIFAQADIPNKNKRLYPLSILEREVKIFNESLIQTKRAVGELSHPNTMEINPDRAAILIEKLEKDGSNFIGKAKVLPTPCGKIVEGLLEGDVKVGVSTRGAGSLKEANKDGVCEVAEDFRLFTIDVVLNPSAPSALVDSIFESEQTYQSIVESFLKDEDLERIMNWRKKVLQENKKLKEFKNNVLLLRNLKEKLLSKCSK